MRMAGRDGLFWAAVGAICLLHVDFWAWDRVHPMIFTWIPYHLWYDGLLMVTGALFYLFWGRRGWPDPPADLNK